jgi:hypothetical protein
MMFNVRPTAAVSVPALGKSRRLCRSSTVVRPPSIATETRVVRKGRKGRKPPNRLCEAPGQTYSTFTISSSSTPAGVRSLTKSPSSARSSALAMGEIQLT